MMNFLPIETRWRAAMGEPIVANYKVVLNRKSKEWRDIAVGWHEYGVILTLSDNTTRTHTCNGILYEIKSRLRTEVVGKPYDPNWW